MNVTIVNKDNKSKKIEIAAFPFIESGFIRLITEGSFVDIKKCMWLNLENIVGIEYER